MLKPKQKQQKKQTQDDQSNSKLQKNDISSDINANHFQNQEYIKQAKVIQNAAKQNSKVVNLQFRKYSKKPEVVPVYVDAKKMHQKLQKMSNKIDYNKYEMVIEVKKDAIDNLATKKAIIKDQIQTKKYTAIYKQFIKTKNTSQIFDINSAMFSVYQYNDQNFNSWKDELRRKLQLDVYHKRTVEKFMEGDRREKKQQASGQDIKEEDQGIDFERFEEFWGYACQNNLFEKVKKAPKAETIVNDLFQNKYYKNRQKKFEHVFNRFQNHPQNDPNLTEQSKNIQNPEYTNKKTNKKLKLNVPQSCKRVFNAQNKLLEQQLEKGLSRDNTKKLIVKFNKTILDMKAKQQDQQNSAQLRKNIRITNNNNNRSKSFRQNKSNIQIKQPKQQQIFHRNKNLEQNLRTVSFRQDNSNQKRTITTSHSKGFRTSRKAYFKKSDCFVLDN